MRVLVLGGTRFMGRYVCTALLEAGMEVTVANRGSRETVGNVTSAMCDRSVSGALEQFANQMFDVVIDFSAYSSAWVEEASRIFAGRIEKYLFISTTAVYTSSETFPVTESFPKGPPHPFAAYAAEKLRSEEILSNSNKAGAFQTTTLRLPFVLGPNNYEDRESFVFSRLRANRPILLENQGKALHSFVFAGDVALGILAVIEADESVAGEAFNLCMRQTTSSLGFVQYAAEIFGKSPNIVYYNPGNFEQSVFDFDLKNVSFPFPQMNSYFGGEKIANAIGFAPRTSLKEALDLYYKWWVREGELQPREYPLESRILASL